MALTGLTVVFLSNGRRGLYRVFTGFLEAMSGLHWVFTRFQSFLLGSSGLLSGLNGFYWVFTGFYSVMSSFHRFP